MMPWNPLSPKGIQGLLHLAQDVQEKAKHKSIWVEIGTHHGEAAALLLGFRYIKKLHCVDILENSLSARRLKDAIREGRCVLHKKSSLDFSEEIDQVDVVYIDGNHNYGDVKSDIAAWYDKIPSGGVLAGHDYNQVSWPGAVKAVDEFLANNKELTLQKYIDSSWAIFKP
jgi:hypothetical protein